MATIIIHGAVATVHGTITAETINEVAANFQKIAILEISPGEYTSADSGKWVHTLFNMLSDDEKEKVEVNEFTRNILSDFYLDKNLNCQPSPIVIDDFIMG